MLEVLKMIYSLPGLLIFIFLLSFLGTIIIRKVAYSKNIIDIPNQRSSHLQPTPRGGGLAIALIWFLSIILFFIMDDLSIKLFLALLCGVPIALVGLLDDVFTISPKIRMLVQITSTCLAIYFIGGISSVDLGFTIIHSSFLFSVLAVVGIVWLTNLFNFLDGIDGYLSVEILFICLSVFFLFNVKIPLLLAASTAGFLIWNWQPAKIFMGDVGSTLLGFTIGVFAVYYQTTGLSSILIWIMLTSLFWFDATLTLYRRVRNNEKIFIAHKKHAYQRVVQSGFSHQKTVLCSLAINITIFGFVWFSVKYPVLMIPLLFINLVVLSIIVRLVDKRFSFH